MSTLALDFAPTGSTSAADEPRRCWDWRFAAGVYAAVVAGSMFAVFWLPGLFGYHQWLTMGDARFTVNTAQYVGNGGVGYVYSANTQFLPLPGYAMLIAPFIALGDHLSLVNGYPLALAHPSMMLIAAPVFAVTGTTAVLGVDYLGWTLGVAGVRRKALALFTGFVVVLPTVCWAGHPEDLLALTLSAFSLGLSFRKRPTAAAVVMALAVLMQPWALLLIPVLAAYSAPGQRIRSLVCSAALPGLTGLLLLAIDWKDAYRALIEQPMQGYGQHLPWWSMSGTIIVNQMGQDMVMRVGSGPRFAAVAIAVVGAWMIRKQVSPQRVMLVAGAALAARAIFETQVWSYYLGPAAVLLGIAVATNPKSWRWAAGLALAFAFYASVAASYNAWQMPTGVALAILVGTAAGALVMAFYGVDGRTSPAMAESTPFTNRPDSSVE